MMTTVAGGASPRGWFTGCRRVAVVGTLTAAAAAGALVTQVQAQGRMEGGGVEGQGGMMLGGPPEHWVRHLDGMLDGLGVTEAQRVQIHRIAMAAAADLRSQREAGRGLRDRGLQLFTAPSIDASAAEVVRQQTMAQQDQSSKRMLQAMLDIAQVLTPEQRAKIGVRAKERQAVMQDRMQRMHDHHREGHRDGMHDAPGPLGPAPSKP